MPRIWLRMSWAALLAGPAFRADRSGIWPSTPSALPRRISDMERLINTEMRIRSLRADLLMREFSALPSKYAA